MSILSILFWIAVVFWTIWFIGYPVYKKIKGQEILTLYYVLVLNIYVLVLDICVFIVSVLNILKLLIF
jgi:hypothetical protein